MGGPIGLATLHAIHFLHQFIHLPFHYHFLFHFCFQLCFHFQTKEPKSQIFTFTFLSPTQIGGRISLENAACNQFFTQLFLLLFFPLLTYPLLRRLLRIFYSSNQSLNQSFANSQDFTHICSKEQYCLANTNKFQCCNEIFEYMSSFVVVFC